MLYDLSICETEFAAQTASSHYGRILFHEIGHESVCSALHICMTQGSERVLRMRDAMFPVKTFCRHS